MLPVGHQMEYQQMVRGHQILLTLCAMVRDNAIIHEISYFSFLSHNIIVDSSCSSGCICVLLVMFNLSVQSMTLSLIPVIYSQ